MLNYITYVSMCLSFNVILEDKMISLRNLLK